MVEVLDVRDDAEVNAIYDRMTRAYGGLDLVTMQAVYTPDAIYMSRREDATVARGRDRFLSMFQGMFDAARAKGDKLDIRFRVIERRWTGAAALDAGYYRLTVTSGGAGEPRVSIGKFFTVSVRQPDGHWAFVADGDTPTPESAWATAAPFGAAKFDA